MAKKPKSRVKNYVLDTNVLLHDPESLYNFQDNNVVIPVEVLRELDHIKGELGSARGANARRVHRILDELFDNNKNKFLKGVTLHNGGTIRMLIPGDDQTYARTADTVRRVLGSMDGPDNADNRIIASAMYADASLPPPTILVSKDINVRLKATAVGLAAQDYLTDKKGAPRDTPQNELALTDAQITEILRAKEIDLHPGQSKGLSLNEYRPLDHGNKAVRYIGNERVALVDDISIHVPGGIDLRPRNPEQAAFIDALLDPHITLVTAEGKAGTGKTLLALGAALKLVVEDGRFESINISKPVVSMGKDLGFLPGSLEEKMRPWLQPYYDALGVLLPFRNAPAAQQPQMEAPSESEIASMSKAARKRFRKQQERLRLAQEAKGNGKTDDKTATKKPYDWVFERNILEIEALAFIRGRSIPRHLFILDEAQQLTPHEMKTVVTRMGEGSKLVLLGDTGQIDNPYVDALSNGFTYLRNKFRGQPCAAHIRLIKGERSALAQLGADLL